MGGNQAENGVKEISVSEGPNDKSKYPFRLGLKLHCTIQGELKYYN